MDDVKGVLKDSLEYYLQREREVISLLASLPKGRIKEKKIKGDRYFYLQYRKGVKVVDDYIVKEVPGSLFFTGFGMKIEFFPSEKGKREKDLKQAVYAGEYIIRNENEYRKFLGILFKIPISWKKRIKLSLRESLSILPEEEPIIQKLLTSIS